MTPILRLVVLGAWLALPNAALAIDVQVELVGTVTFNNLGAPMNDPQVGDLVMFQFTVDSEEFVDSKTEPVRGYVIDVASFALTIGPESLDLADPYPDGVAQFALKDDASADYVFFTRDAGVHNGLTLVHTPSLEPYSYFGGITLDETTFHSLDIEDAIGSYDVSGAVGTVFGAAGPLGGELLVAYDALTISVAVPAETTTWGAIKAHY